VFVDFIPVLIVFLLIYHFFVDHLLLLLLRVRSLSSSFDREDFKDHSRVVESGRE